MSVLRSLLVACLLPLGLALASPAAAQSAPAVSPNPVSPNLEHGKEINGTCAACHGEFGQGGKKGEYPRIAGQRVLHLEEQLRNFRARKRMNIPMFPYTQERELSDEDIRDVAAYLAKIELPTTPPDFKDSDDALTRLLAMDKVMIIPKLDGDLAAGRATYEDQCADCHGKFATGKGRFPMLVGQYTAYLRRQWEIFARGERTHDEEDGKGIAAKLGGKEFDDLLAYITHLQGAAPATPPAAKP